MRLTSGPPNPEYPYRYGCVCGAVWNADEPIDFKKHNYGLCGPFCQPTLFELKDEDG